MMQAVMKLVSVDSLMKTLEDDINFNMLQFQKSIKYRCNIRAPDVCVCTERLATLCIKVKKSDVH